MHWLVVAAVGLACALAAVLAATSDVHVDLAREYPSGRFDPGPLFCGSAYDVTLFARGGYLGGEVPLNQAEVDAACVSGAGRRMVLAALFGLAGAAAVVVATRLRHRARPASDAAPPTGPLVDRVGAMIGFFYFLVSITVAGLLGIGAWWVNVNEQPAALGFVGVALGAALLAFLPRFPRETFIACGALAFLLYGGGVLLGLPTVVMALIALFGVTLWTDRRSGLWALTASLGALGLAVVLLFVRYGFYLPPLEMFVSDRVAIFLFNSSGVVVLTWAVADQVRAARERRALQRQSEAHAAEAAAHHEAEQAARGQVEALADRHRIAREMHDIVAHGLSVMIVQADGARFAAASDPAAATTALATIASTGRASLAEMRRLLSVLRDDTAPVPEGPQPGLGDVPALVQTLVDTGRDIRLTVHGDLSESAEADAVGLTAYRTVQEALTNVMKHAGDDPTAWVTLTVEPRRVVVDVVDDGPGVSGAPTRGHGLRGMSERVEMVGGHLVTGPDARGGFRVLATLPRGDDA
ncbi:hypothetical protein IDVR_01210 [Intrasporangium sp. DVR]